MAGNYTLSQLINAEINSVNIWVENYDPYKWLTEKITLSYFSWAKTRDRELLPFRYIVNNLVEIFLFHTQYKEYNLFPCN